MTRTPLLLAAAGAVLALAACGSGSNDNNAANGPDKAFAGALKFAKCMRDHGVDMPDPTRSANGGIMQTGPGPGKGSGPELRPDDAKMQAANDACKKYLSFGGGHAPDPAKMAQARGSFLAYARCMRGKGLNFPDPKFSNNGVQMTLPRGLGPDSPAFKAADKACHPLLAAIEKGKP